MQRHTGPLAKDFMGKGVVTVHRESAVQEAVKAMDEHNIGSVVVLDSLGPCGVFTERDLVSRVLGRGMDPDRTQITEVMSPRFPSIDSSATLEDAAAAMINKKSRLMVFEGSELVGMVTPTDIVRAIRVVGEDFSILKVISIKVSTVFPETPVGVVTKLMNERKIGSTIVAEEGRWIGIFTERDLVKRVLAKHHRLDSPARKFASSPLVTAEPGILGREAAGIMSVHGFKRLPLVVGGEGVGIVTARDLVEAYANASHPMAPRVDWVQWN